MIHTDERGHPICLKCNGPLDEDWDCVECGRHRLTPEEERDVRGDMEYDWRMGK